jgi:hypothetical protein
MGNRLPLANRAAPYACATRPATYAAPYVLRPAPRLKSRDLHRTLRSAPRDCAAPFNPLSHFSLRPAVPLYPATHCPFPLRPTVPFSPATHCPTFPRPTSPLPLRPPI